MIVIIGFLIVLWISLFYLSFLLMYTMYTIQKPKIELRKSNIHNRGIFANEYIKKGDIIEEIPLISYVSIKEINKTVLKDYVISMPQNLNKGDTQNCSVMLGYGSIYNHSDTNNAEWNFLNDQKMIIKAIKDIYPNQEICVNYGNGYWRHRNYNKK
jgi:SET domain-containing protein